MPTTCHSIHSATLFSVVAFALFLSGARPAQAAQVQKADVTEAELLANCSDEIRASDQDLLALRQASLAKQLDDQKSWRARQDRGDPAIAIFVKRNIDEDQKLIDGYRADIDDLTTRGLQSSRSYLHSNDDFYINWTNKLSRTDLRNLVAEFRAKMKRGSANRDEIIQACLYSVRLAKLEGKPAPKPGQAAPVAKAVARAPAPSLVADVPIDPRFAMFELTPVQSGPQNYPIERGPYHRLLNICGDKMLDYINRSVATYRKYHQNGGGSEQGSIKLEVDQLVSNLRQAVSPIAFPKAFSNRSQWLAEGQKSALDNQAGYIAKGPPNHATYGDIAINQPAYYQAVDQYSDRLIYFEATSCMWNAAVAQLAAE